MSLLAKNNLNYSWFFVLFILFYPFLGNIDAQNCDVCDQTLNINGDFFVSDDEVADCPPQNPINVYFIGSEMITNNCVSGWNGGGGVFVRSLSR